MSTDLDISSVVTNVANLADNCTVPPVDGERKMKNSYLSIARMGEIPRCLMNVNLVHSLSVSTPEECSGKLSHMETRESSGALSD